jgi:hypothetical protein
LASPGNSAALHAFHEIGLGSIREFHYRPTPSNFVSHNPFRRKVFTMAMPRGWILVARPVDAISVVRRQLFFMACTASIFGLLARARGGEELRNVESQRREFAISIDGTKRGTCTMQIRRRNDGTMSMRSEAEIRINYLVYRYNYTSAGTEIWKHGRLLAMENVADYNGTQYRVKVASTGKSLQLNVDGTVSQIAPDVWLTSYWQTPDRLAQGELADRTAADPNSLSAPEHGGPRFVSIIDSDLGKKLRGNVVRIGNETLTVAGDEKVCTHYRLTGDATVDLWYDASGRLVRQDSTESRHKVRFELSEIAAE